MVGLLLVYMQLRNKKFFILSASPQKSSFIQAHFIKFMYQIFLQSPRAIFFNRANRNIGGW